MRQPKRKGLTMPSSFSVESLVQTAPRIIGQWQREFLTTRVTANWFLHQCSWTLFDHPIAADAVEGVLYALPLPLLVGLIDRFQERQRPDGNWNWPLQDEVLSYGVAFHPVDKPAGPLEEVACRKFHDCLMRSRAKRLPQVHPPC
jgi:hypothetical protein